MVIKLLNTSEYLELCEAIGDEILLLPISQTYKKLQQEIKTNSEINELINKFDCIVCLLFFHLVDVSVD